MVYKTKNLFRIKPHELGKHLKKYFIDRLRIYVKSGDGGNGLSKFGGIGGNGGNILIQAKNNTTLKKVYSSNLAKRYLAGHGEKSSKLKLFGDHGNDILIEVPCGITAVTDNGVIIGEVNSENDKLVIAAGGKGGSSVNKYIGQKGQSFSINLDLKLIADIGLIGFPNAGKSTLLSLVSRAQPKIANYPFTTLNPQLGIIEYDDNRRITIADLPGLIEGAHFNRGMGHKFLKHVSRTKINLFVVDINGFQLNSKYQTKSAFETAIYLNKELELYENNLIKKPSILILNKIDTDESKKKYDDFMRLYNDYENAIKTIDEYWRPTERVEFDHVLDISAKKNVNVEKLCLLLRDMLDKLDKQKISDNKSLSVNSKKLIPK